MHGTRPQTRPWHDSAAAKACLAQVGMPDGKVVRAKARTKATACIPRHASHSHTRPGSHHSTAGAHLHQNAVSGYDAVQADWLENFQIYVERSIYRCKERGLPGPYIWNDFDQHLLQRYERVYANLLADNQSSSGGCYSASCPFTNSWTDFLSEPRPDIGFLQPCTSYSAKSRSLQTLEAVLPIEQPCASTRSPDLLSCQMISDNLLLALPIPAINNVVDVLAPLVAQSTSAASLPDLISFSDEFPAELVAGNYAYDLAEQKLVVLGLEELLSHTLDVIITLCAITL